jgi:hypothetical protein
MRASAQMDDAIRHGSEDRTTDVEEQITGRTPTSIEDFLRANASLLSRHGT